jgi:predicted transcriptional regulator
MAIRQPVEVAVDVVSAYVSNNPTPRADLTSLIQVVYAAVERLGKGSESTPGQVEAKGPAVPVRNSVTPEYLICLEDGKKFKFLRHHLRVLGLTPEEYRAKWNLLSNYPMVAANYSNSKSVMAKKAGLGQNRKEIVDQKSVRVIPV